MKSPIDQGGAIGLIYNGFEVRASSRTDTLKLWLQQYPVQRSLRYIEPIVPRFFPAVKSFGPIRACVLAPKPFVGRTRLGVNQGDRKRYIRGALETGAQGKTGLVDTLGARPATKEGEAFLIMSSDWYQAGVEAENLLRVSKRSGGTYG
jgi:hypothetical protein